MFRIGLALLNKSSLGKFWMVLEMLGKITMSIEIWLKCQLYPAKNGDYILL